MKAMQSQCHPCNRVPENEHSSFCIHGYMGYENYHRGQQGIRSASYWTSRWWLYSEISAY